MEKVSQLAPELGLELHYRGFMSTDEYGGLRLGQLIRQARLALGWTQKDVAEEADVSVETIKRYERGATKSPDSELLRNLIRVLKLDGTEVAIALGFVKPGELDLPPSPPRSFPPEVEEAIEILQDPLMSETAKTGALQYLRFLQSNMEKETPGTGRSQSRAS